MLKKYYLSRFFWVPILHKRYQNTSGFAGACITKFNKNYQNTLRINWFKEKKLYFVLEQASMNLDQQQE